MTRRLHTQAVVVGGGPVGMLVAAELARYGVRTVVLESQDQVSVQPKGNTLHARTVQSLVRRGYLAPPVTAGAPVTRSFHFAGLPGLPITAPSAEPEPLLKRPQAELTRLFEERASAAGAQVLRGHRVVRVGQGPDQVEVTAEGPDGPVTWVAEYLVGADGPRSLVREQAGIPSTTRPATVSALSGVVSLPDPQALTPGWHPGPRGWVVASPMPEGTSYVRTLDCAGPAADRHRPPTLAELRQEVSRIVGRDIAMAQPHWLGRFSDFSRLAGTFRTGRILLAGDAAHVHFPIGGQGLSTGLLDAVNLGWKLALTILGRVGPDLLDSYDLERRPAAQRVVDNSHAQLALMRPDPALDPLRALFAELVAADGGSGLLSGLLSAQDTVFPAPTRKPSPREGTFLQNVRLTTQAGETDVIGLLAQGQPLLLLLGGEPERYQEQAQGWAELVRVVHAAPTPDIPYEALLVRPDGYLAWASDGDALSEALAAYFGPRPDLAAGGVGQGGGLVRSLS
ncbi:FAD-dependent monooxygenase [Kitasatospora sp. NBC_01266]|uniref:FAD-dependent monooxygenase n=1 Tax=Kitasatospora sp. NBC_01266 TaxID=2903572 RepID=UPI002E2FF578|nr:FAD-dependent monooxygenase [Kitasatospora sp. NBC_01266]